MDVPAMVRMVIPSMLFIVSMSVSNIRFPPFLFKNTEKYVPNLGQTLIYNAYQKNDKEKSIWKNNFVIVYVIQILCCRAFVRGILAKTLKIENER